MKKVININFQGRVVPIEETAYDILEQYVESLRRYFANEEGKDEIINDIEGRIAELFGETLKKGSTCITDNDVIAIMNSMGRPEDFEADEASLQSQLGAAGQRKSAEEGSSAGTQAEGAARPHRLYRDENHKLLGGVCAGIGNYFGIDRIIVRILFILGILLGGITFIVCLILWVAVPSSASIVIGSARKRLFRDPETKIIAGVCGGLASYFGIHVWIPRVLFLIPFISFATNWNDWGMFDFPTFLNLTFSPGSVIVYIILWLILPEAKSTSEKLEMKGEKVDLTSIKTTIQQDMEGFKDRAQQFGTEVKDKAQELGASIGTKGKQFGSEAGALARKTGKGLGDLIALIFKIFAYFILAVVLFAIVAALFGVGIAFTGFIPYKGYFISDGWQEVLAWGTFILFIWVPVIGIITWIIRRIAGIKSNKSMMGYTFTALWVVGWFCVISLIASVRNDFLYHNSPVEQTVALSNPDINKLELKYARNSRYYFRNSWLHLEPFASIDEDTAFVKNIHVRLLKAEDSSFHVTMLKMVNGSSKKQAEDRATRMNYNVSQKDTSLLFDQGISITKTEKFRNQAVYVTVYVPVGKRILVNDNLGWGEDMHIGFSGDVDEWSWRHENEGYSWDNGVEYIMTEKGLQSLYPRKRFDEDENEDRNDYYDDRDNDTLRNNDDSSRYQYKPAKKIEEPKKIEVKANVLPAENKNSGAVDIHELALSLFSRSTI